MILQGFAGMVQAGDLAGGVETGIARWWCGGIAGSGERWSGIAQYVSSGIELDVSVTELYADSLATGVGLPDSKDYKWENKR
ncbi:hypothetical protein CJO66_33235 [Burkholderia ubonensis]|nr:hypothetical protein CJO70_32595 [Burkholderia ubonensis]PAJ90704.1 hypothetical protein CJO69_31295 [Burkholderia ubonensis]PAK03946.1 hypothetical protein CJO67_31810 [Burkholderia ubonensis]PAK10423.1 hypothetical protein CJO66_33235 [Burkholderia ubonensis]RQP76264.1 hypothetical protein DF013_13210 [Burkholderia ubonensis]